MIAESSFMRDLPRALAFGFLFLGAGNSRAEESTPATPPAGESPPHEPPPAPEAPAQPEVDSAAPPSPPPEDTPIPPRTDSPPAAAPGDGPSETEPPPIVSTLDFETSAYLSVLFAERAVPDAGSLNPIGGSLYAAIRYVPKAFPFHASFETGGGLFATGSTLGPSGTEYQNMQWTLFFLPGIGLELDAFRFTAGAGPALVFSTSSSDDTSSTTTSLAVAGDVGLSYRFFEKTSWASSVGLRFQTAPGAKLNALCLGVQLRFGSIVYR